MFLDKSQIKLNTNKQPNERYEDSNSPLIYSRQNYSCPKIQHKNMKGTVMKVYSYVWGMIPGTQHSMWLDW